jgi:hypothetical protein
VDGQGADGAEDVRCLRRSHGGIKYML